MTLLDLVQANLLSPPVLCFALGACAVWVRSDLKLPEQFFAGLTVFLMLAIGLKGGAELSKAQGSEVAGALIGALALGCAIPIWSYALLRRVCGLGPIDAAGVAAHYGSVSAVTFAAVIAMLEWQGMPVEGYTAALLAIMEVPGIIVAVALGRMALAGRPSVVAVTSGGAAVLGGPASLGLGPVLREIFSSKSVILLVGGLAIGALAGPTGLAKVKPFFGDLFQGVLCLFLLELGRLTASRAAEFRQVGPKLVAFAVLVPIFNATVGIAVAYVVGLSEGGAIVLGTLAASASYIAAPAAVRMALPEANPAYYLTCSLAITFPFNIAIGLALYSRMAAYLYG